MLVSKLKGIICNLSDGLTVEDSVTAATSSANTLVVNGAKEHGEKDSKELASYSDSSKITRPPTHDECKHDVVATSAAAKDTKKDPTKPSSDSNGNITPPTSKRKHGDDLTNSATSSIDDSGVKKRSNVCTWSPEENEEVKGHLNSIGFKKERVGEIMHHWEGRKSKKQVEYKRQNLRKLASLESNGNITPPTSKRKHGDALTNSATSSIDDSGVKKRSNVCTWSPEENEEVKGHLNSIGFKKERVGEIMHHWEGRKSKKQVEYKRQNLRKLQAKLEKNA